MNTFPLFLKSCAPLTGSLLSRDRQGLLATIQYLFLDATRQRHVSNWGILLATLLVLSLYPALGSSTPLFREVLQIPRTTTTTIQGYQVCLACSRVMRGSATQAAN